MDGLERKMPSTIDYSDVLPLSVPAVSRRRKFYPTNGGEFRAEANSEIRIPIDSTTALLDAAHSYLEFSIQNFDPAVTLSLDAGGAAMFFSRVRVEQQGKVLSDTQEYNRLVASVINPCTETAGGRLAASIRDSTPAGQTDGNGNAAPYIPGFNRGDRRAFSAHGNGTKIGVGGTYTFAMPLLTGLFTQDKLIPLPLVDKNNPITLVLNLESEENLGCWAGGGGAAPAPQAIAIMKVCYNAQLVEVGGDVIQQFSMMRDMMGGQLAISGQDWEHSAFFLTGGAAGGGGQRVVNLPVRKRSIKSLFWVANSDNLANTAGPLGRHQIFNKSFGGHCNIDSWQLKVGSVTYPPTPIEGPGNGALQPSQYARGECLKELAKAMGTLSFVNPTGSIINTITYFGQQSAAVAGLTDTATGDNGIGGLTQAPEVTNPIFVAPFGIDLESFQHTAIESGVDSETMALDTNLLLNINSVAGNIGGEDKTIHSWFCFDKHYYFNKDMSVSVSD